MSTCIRGGIKYKRHQWNDALRTLDGDNYEVIQLCMACGTEETHAKGRKAAPGSESRGWGTNPTEPTVQNPSHKREVDSNA